MTNMIESEELHQDIVERLRKELRQATESMSEEDARFLVDRYYQIQRERMAAGNQINAAKKEERETPVLEWFAANLYAMEKQVAKALDHWSGKKPVGAWVRQVMGIGPVLAAGLIAHIDITKAPHPSSLWSYAGLNPNAVWEKGKKRPWNGRLKVLQWKIRESFVKVSSNPKSLYGRLYVERKAQEEQRNAEGKFSEQATTSCSRYKKDTTAHDWTSGKFSSDVVLQFRKLGLPMYVGLTRKLPTVEEIATKAPKALAAEEHGVVFQAGVSTVGTPMLSPGHIHARSQRYAVKVFLVHYHGAAYRLHYGCEPPDPWVIAHGNHVDKIDPEVPYPAIS